MKNEKEVVITAEKKVAKNIRNIFLFVLTFSLISVWSQELATAFFTITLITIFVRFCINTVNTIKSKIKKQ